ncbi:hypothetical protein [Amycolatopsis sp. NPDC049159]|uniref:hypothetical protein n=1 Tax=Amycolatopsis sp. NPDC049159 TaxID=3157210 RepID=UPI0033FD9FD6
MTGMRTVVHGEGSVHYGQIYVHSAGGEPFEGDLSACFAGQHNGLCGAAVAGTLFLLTGLHTGEVGFTAEVHESEPPDDEPAGRNRSRQPSLPGPPPASKPVPP